MSFTEVWRQHDFAATSRAIQAKTAADVRRALGRVEAGIDLDDLQALLSPAAAPFLEEMAQLSHRRTVERYGRTIQIFAPLYLTNVCANVCTYCGFSAQNRIPRRILNADEIRAEAAEVLASGRYMQEVRTAQALWRARGITSVPAVVVEDKYLISGGQPTQVFVNALREIAGKA